jgi:hypothetical protein
MRVLGGGDRAGLVSAMNLWPVSEFSLVLTAIGLKLGHVEAPVLDVVLFTMILTAVAGTYLIGASHPLYVRMQGWLDRRGWGRPGAGAPEGASSAHAADRPIALLGFHRIASAFLHDLEATRPELLKKVLVVDFNPVVLEELRRRGVACAYGDLANPDTLHHVGLEGAEVIVCTIPDTLFKGTNNLRLLANVRGLCPGAKVVATAETAAVEQALLAAGAAAVLVPQRAAGASALSDVLALLDGRRPPSAAASDVLRPEVLP